jgi:release factor glutamine methyltransferase
MLRADAPTLSGWLRLAEESLRESRCPSPRFDAERLAAHALGVHWGEIWTRMREPIERNRLDDVLSRRVSGEPLAYIVGSALFCGIELECGPGVLVPRVETETLVDVALELIAEYEEPIVVDIGTGTGAVAIAIAKARPDAQVWATDKYWNALRFAERNDLRLHTGLNIAQGDLFDALPRTVRGRCGLVVSNPPYVAAGADVAYDVRSEPNEAVFAGPVGDEVIRRLAGAAADWVAPDGAMALEIGSGDQAGIRWHGFGVPQVRFDNTRRPRVVWARR